MELLFESRVCLGGITGKVLAVQGKPELHEEPVLVGDTEVDGSGASIYGSVLWADGRFRMWYQAWPSRWTGKDAAQVAYAESEDGVEWRKPDLAAGRPDRPGGNLTNLSFHSPSVFIDPCGAATHRYRATGFARPGHAGACEAIRSQGYYTAHSADGLDWELDTASPVWPGADVITSFYHPGRSEGLVALKQIARYRGIPRRSIWNAGLRDGVWTRESRALVPDDFDDVAAISRGFAGGDYYGMGMQAAANSVVGFLWQFRHTLPRTATVGYEAGIFGSVGVSLAFQERAGDCWQHAPARMDFIPHDALSWAEGGFYTSSCPVEYGEEHRLYLCGARHTHGWYLDSSWGRRERWTRELMDEGLARITYASWPRWRLFGFRADPEGSLELRLEGLERPCRLVLNYECDPTGSVRVAVSGDEARSKERAVALTGSSLDAVVAWEGGDLLGPVPESGRMTLQLHLERATVWAFELRPVE
ncbi:MAG: hypothetical protein R3F07_10255 [Opitutaceae bacterium]